MESFLEGAITVSAAVEQGMEPFIAAMTGLTERAVKRRMNQARGNTLLRNTFDWPEGTAAIEALGSMRTALARDELIFPLIADVVQMSVGWVRRRLSEANGNLRVSGVFDDRWPELEVVDDVDAADESEDADENDPLGWHSVATARNDESIQEAIAERTGLTERRVWNRLQKANGHMLVRNAFVRYWELSSGGTDSQDNEGVDSNPQSQTRSSQRYAGRTASGTSGLSTGTVIDDRYLLKRKLGEGGFGEAWRAQDQSLDKIRVLKFAHSDSPGDALLREAKAAIDLKHENICTYFDVKVDRKTGRPFIVMQDCGSSLADLIRKGGKISPSRAIEIVVAVADALEHAHGKNILHLDINPGNVLIDEQGQVYVADFGLASEAIAQLRTGGMHTKIAETVIGRHPTYSAPELLLGEKPSRRSDQYSLALVFCSMMERQLFEERYRHRAFGRLSDAQNRAVYRALQKDLQKRFPSCEAFAKALQEY